MSSRPPSFNAINFNFSAGGPCAPFPHAGATNRTGLIATVSTYLCPSDSRTTPYTLAESFNAYSQTSYFPSGGTWNTLAYYQGPECWQMDPGNGAFDTPDRLPRSRLHGRHQQHDLRGGDLAIQE